MQKNIVIIEGANYCRSKNELIQKGILLFYRLFNVIPIYSGEHEKWLNLIEKRDRSILYFNWSGGFLPHQVKQASAEFVNYLADKEDVVVIATSLGAEVALEASGKTQRISKIVALSGVYRPRNVAVPVIDIFSTSDRFANFFRGILRFFALHEKMRRREVVLHGIRHDQFRENTKLDCEEFRGKDMAWLINTAIDELGMEKKL